MLWHVLIVKLLAALLPAVLLVEVLEYMYSARIVLSIMTRQSVIVTGKHGYRRQHPVHGLFCQ